MVIGDNVPSGPLLWRSGRVGTGHSKVEIAKMKRAGLEQFAWGTALLVALALAPATLAADRVVVLEEFTSTT